MKIERKLILTISEAEMLRNKAQEMRQSHIGFRQEEFKPATDVFVLLNRELNKAKYIEFEVSEEEIKKINIVIGKYL